MSSKRLHGIKGWLPYIIVFLLFVYFRAKPIYYQTVPYTYDQGRDFLKAEEIIRFKNPTFIGPTTGIAGVNHGVWWYYFLAGNYALFGGNPSGFYWGVLIMTLISTILFTAFLKKEFGNYIAFLFLLIVTVSPYFVGISIFAGNNILAPPFVLLFIYSAYELFKTGKKKFVFLTALSLSLIFESEMPFGIFIIPSFFVASLLFGELRKLYLSRNSLLALLSGLIVPFTFRILFEIKHNFSQIKGIITFFNNPSATNAQSFKGIIHERAILFLSYFKEIFYENNNLLVFVVILLMLSILICRFKTLSSFNQKIFRFFISMIVLIFMFSLVYRNNFFWDYYLEGIQYLLLFPMLLLLYSIKESKKLIIGILIFYSVLVGVKTHYELNNHAVPTVGLRADIATIKQVQSIVGKEDFCARIYTPPVVPHTYNYLFHYYNLSGYKVPLDNPVNNTCIVMIDPDTYAFRIEEWRKNNIPEDFVKTKEVIMSNKVKIEVWTKK